MLCIEREGGDVGVQHTWHSRQGTGETASARTCAVSETTWRGRNMETRPAQLMRFSEFLQPRPPTGPVRIVARLGAYDLMALTGEVVGENAQQRLRVELPEPLPGPLVIGKLYQLLGELKSTPDGPVLSIRLMRDVEGLDVALWEETLVLRRQFLALDS